LFRVGTRNAETAYVCRLLML